MFLLYFLVFTLIFTIFENMLLAGCSLLLVAVSLLIYQWIRKKKMLSKKTIWLIILSFILAMGAFWVKEYRYYGTRNFNTGTWDEGRGTRNTAQIIVGTGIIDDISSQGRYVFSYKNDKYLMYSKKQYSIGDQLWVVGRMDSIRKAGRRNEVQEKYRTISSGTFDIPLFSGSFDFNKWIKMKGRKGTIYEENSIKLEAGSGKLEAIGFIKKLKKGLQTKIVQVYGKNRISGLILGMLIGDKSQIPKSDYQYFVNSGLVHLIAVSGGNILMIVVFLQCVLFFVPFYLRLGLILLTIMGYSLICGMDSSVFRAVLMGGMSMIALFRGREINIRRLLSTSCIIMLLINPYFLAYDTGFLLSYSALIGIVYFNTGTGDPEASRAGKGQGTRTEENAIHRGLQYIYKNYISPSIGASIGIFPIIIFFMGKINLLGILGNLLVLPIVPFVMIYGFVSVWLYVVLGWDRLLWIENVLVQYIYHISELLSQYGIYFTVGGLRPKYLIFGLFLVIFVMWRTRYRDEEKRTRDEGKVRGDKEKGTMDVE